jgi:energy-coupling factor transporter ATP-binding protein EcfA2
MRISSLRLKDIGPFVDSTIEFPKGTNDGLADVYLLVGQNGCGKTTALHAIASALLAPEVPTGFNRRVNGEGALVVETSVGAFGAVAGGSRTTDESNHAKARALGLNPLLPAGQSDGLTFFMPSASGDSGSWLLWARSMNDQRLIDPLTWAAFAYSGASTFHDPQVTTISEISEGPLSGSLGFESNASSQRLAQWIVLQDYRIGKASDPRRKAELKRSLDLLSDTVAAIIGTSFSFHIAEEQLTPRALVSGKSVELGLLPRGLQAIIGWVGDLLMRLDRIPWSGSLPPSQREFLLLLDEIDLHLHPAWQRKVLPAVQKLFPKAQVIASTHSPFVVASLRDGAVIELRIDENGKSAAQPPLKTWEHNGGVPHNYSGVLSRLFGINSDFDLEEERQIRAIQDLAHQVMLGDLASFPRLEAQAKELQLKSDEYLGQLVEFELRQARASMKP